MVRKEEQLQRQLSLIQISTAIQNESSPILLPSTAIISSLDSYRFINRTFASLGTKSPSKSVQTALLYGPNLLRNQPFQLLVSYIKSLQQYSPKLRSRRTTKYSLLASLTSTKPYRSQRLRQQPLTQLNSYCVITNSSLFLTLKKLINYLLFEVIELTTILSYQIVKQNRPKASSIVY